MPALTDAQRQVLHEWEARRVASTHYRNISDMLASISDNMADALKHHIIHFGDESAKATIRVRASILQGLSTYFSGLSKMALGHFVDARQDLEHAYKVLSEARRLYNITTSKPDWRGTLIRTGLARTFFPIPEMDKIYEYAARVQATHGAINELAREHPSLGGLAAVGEDTLRRLSDMFSAAAASWDHGAGAYLGTEYDPELFTSIAIPYFDENTAKQAEEIIKQKMHQLGLTDAEELRGTKYYEGGSRSRSRRRQERSEPRVRFVVE